MSELIDYDSSTSRRPFNPEGEEVLHEVPGFRTAGMVVRGVVLGVAQLADEVERDQDKSSDEQ